MSDLTRYRSHDKCKGKGRHNGTDGLLCREDGCIRGFVPDATLQQIADAWQGYMKPRAGTDEWLVLKALLDGLVNDE